MHCKRYFLSTFSIACIIALLGLLSSCGDADDDIFDNATLTFIHDGLDGKTIGRLYQYNGAVFAATDSGLYVKTDGNNNWKAIGLTHFNVLDLAILNGDHYLAATSHTATAHAIYHLMETTDAGRSWHQVEHNFGGEYDQAIFALHYDRDNMALYATGTNVLAASFDEGRNWEILHGNWHGSGQRISIVKRNAATNEIWYGGQNALEQAVLCAYSLDTGGTHCVTDLMPTPSAIFGIQFDSNHASRIIASGEGGALQSNDNGETWTVLIGDVAHRFYFDIALDPEKPQTLYTGGWDKNWYDPQPLILEISKDNGITWTQFHYPSNRLFGGIKSLISVRKNHKTVIYLGLHRGGIMKVNMP